MEATVFYIKNWVAIRFWGIRLLHCTRLLGTHGYLVGSGEKMVSGNIPIESGHAQGCFFFWKIAIWDSGSPFWDSGSPPRALGRAQGCFFSEKWQSGILEGLHTVIAYPHGY